MHWLSAFKLWTSISIHKCWTISQSKSVMMPDGRPKERNSNSSYLWPSYQTSGKYGSCLPALSLQLFLSSAKNLNENMVLVMFRERTSYTSMALDSVVIGTLPDLNFSMKKKTQYKSEAKSNYKNICSAFYFLSQVIIITAFYNLSSDLFHLNMHHRAVAHPDFLCTTYKPGLLVFIL